MPGPFWHRHFIQYYGKSKESQKVLVCNFFLFVDGYSSLLVVSPAKNYDRNEGWDSSLLAYLCRRYFQHKIYSFGS